MHTSMDHTRFWLWSRTKFVSSPHFQPLVPAASTASQAVVATYGDSWEERAFAEDSAGRLGGCVWPPRSYSCNFCRREFRSAQALGGHMNVHRRDRARLKQSSPNSPGETSSHLQAYHPIDIPPPQVAYTSNPNPNPTLFVPSPLSPSTVRASAVPLNQEHSREKSNLISSSYSLPIIQEQRKASPIFSSPPTPLDSFSVKPQTALELKMGDESMSSRKIGCKEKREYSFKDEEGSKKHKTDDQTISFLKLSSSDEDHDQNKYGVSENGHGLTEELDLELRLGDRPKVK